MKGFLLLILLQFLAPSLSQTLCNNTQVCANFHDPACKTLKDRFQRGDITLTDIKAKACANNRICCDNAEEEGLVVRAATSQCSSGSSCKTLGSCQPLVDQLLNGVPITQFIKCGDGFCCPGDNTGDNSNPEAAVLDEDPDSPSFVPRVDKNECGGKAVLGHIIGGDITKIGTYTFPVALGRLIRRKIDYVCGGSLINRWYVLSAAHCHNPSAPLDRANIGEWNIKDRIDCSGGNCLPKNQIRAIEKTIVHENFIHSKSEVKNDIALVKLKKPVEMNDYVHFVCLPFGRSIFETVAVNNLEDDLIDVRAHAVGWGLTDPDYKVLIDSAATSSRSGAQKQMRVELPIISEEDCRKKWRTIRYSEGHLCAGGEVGKDTCSGDSGGPLVITSFNARSKKLVTALGNAPWFIIGLTSFGSSDCGGGAPGVYTRVAFFENWIRRNLN